MEEESMFRRFLACLPWWVAPLGRLDEVSNKNLGEALKEVTVATLFATMPLWFLPILGPFLFTESTSLFDTIKNGEMFIYSAALSGPFVYIITKPYGDSKNGILDLSIRFPYGTFLLATSLILCVVSGVAFLLLKNPIFSKPVDTSRINYSGIVTLSWIFFTLTTITLFCVTAYKNMLDNTKISQNDKDEVTMSEWERHKSDQ